jgi:hypothetical protein
MFNSIITVKSKTSIYPYILLCSVAIIIYIQLHKQSNIIRVKVLNIPQIDALNKSVENWKLEVHNKLKYDLRFVHPVELDKDILKKSKLLENLKTINWDKHNGDKLHTRGFKNYIDKCNISSLLGYNIYYKVWDQIDNEDESRLLMNSLGYPVVLTQSKKPWIRAINIPDYNDFGDKQYMDTTHDNTEDCYSFTGRTTGIHIAQNKRIALKLLSLREPILSKIILSSDVTEGGWTVPGDIQNFLLDGNVNYKKQLQCKNLINIDGHGATFISVKRYLLSDGLVFSYCGDHFTQWWMTDSSTKYICCISLNPEKLKQEITSCNSNIAIRKELFKIIFSDEIICWYMKLLTSEVAKLYD